MAYRSDQRWDRERFERLRRYPDERDYYRFEERDGPRRSDIVLDERIEKRGPRGRFEERERYIERDRYDPPGRRNTAGFFEERPPPETTGQALAPYRRPRPQFVRRQSSLDTFDRRPMARYGDEYRMPADVPIPLPIRKPRSPPRGRYMEEYEDVRYRDGEEDYRDVRVREERRGKHRSQSRMRSRSVLHRRGSSSSSSDSSFEEIEKGSEIGRKGRTKMPKRLITKAAVIEKGLPFEEEDEFIIVLRALDKSHIDEIVELSAKYRAEQSIAYKYEGIVPASEGKKEKKEKKEEGKEVEKEVKKEEIRREEIKPDGTRTVEKIEKVEKKEEVVEEPEHHHHEPPAVIPVPAGEIIKRTTTTTVIDPPDHHHHHQDLAVVVPRHHRNSEASIRREIKALEAERKALQLERSADWRLVEAERLRDGDWELVERERDSRDRRPRNVIRVEKDRKVVRSRSRGPPPKLVGLALATLT